MPDRPSFSPRRLLRPALIPLTALAVCAVAASDPSTPWRTWTSIDGRSVQGTYLKSNETSVTIRRSEGRIVEIPLDRLTEEDRAFVAGKAEEEQAQDTDEPKAAKTKGPLTYQLSDGHDKWDEGRKKRITDAMDEAVALYNQHGKFKKHVTANNSPGTPTADANYDGWINFGGSINARVALHEIAHTLGVGTHPNWQANIKEGLWTGKNALKLVREYDGKEAVLHADRQHFWPYGLNQDHEASEANNVRHIKMVEALRKDMKIRD